MKKNIAWGLFFMSPYLIHLLFLFVGPLCYSLYLSFTKYDLFNPPVWIGLKNWYRLLRSEAFWQALRNSLVIWVIFAPLQAFLALFVAHAMNNIARCKGVFRLMYFLPVLTPWVAAGAIWRWFLAPTKVGIINYLITLLLPGIKPAEFIYDDRWWVVIVCLALIKTWKEMGTAMVIFLAALQNIPQEIIESSEIDGANNRQRFLRIVVPMVSPTTFLILILATISSFKVFDLFYVMLDGASSGTILDKVNCVNVMMYQNAFLFGKMGYATVIAWCLFVIVSLLTLFQKRMEKRWVYYG